MIFLVFIVIYCYFFFGIFCFFFGIFLGTLFWTEALDLSWQQCASEQIGRKSCWNPPSSGQKSEERNVMIQLFNWDKFFVWSYLIVLFCYLLTRIEWWLWMRITWWFEEIKTSRSCKRTSEVSWWPILVEDSHGLSKIIIIICK